MSLPNVAAHADQPIQRIVKVWSRANAEERLVILDQLDDEQRKLVLEAVERGRNVNRVTFEDPTALQLAIDPSAMRARHLTALGRLIIRAETEQVFATVSLPTRHAKSTTIGQFGPAWFLGRNPNRRVVVATAGKDLAVMHCQAVRDIIQDHPDMFSVEVEAGSAAKDNWKIAGSMTGGMLAIGSGGKIIGRGGDLIIIDDPYGSEAEARSPAFRRDIVNWYKGTIRSRLEPGGSIIVVMARWHPDDLVGHIQSNFTGWEHITIPAVAGDNDPLGRLVGEPLWPERYDLDGLAAVRREVGPYIWACQYQQQPSGVDTSDKLSSRACVATVNQNRFVISRPDGQTIEAIPMFRFATVDWAVGLKDDSDYTAFSLWNLTACHHLVMEGCVIGRYREPVKAVARLAKRAKRRYPVVSEALGIQGDLTKRLARLGVNVFQVSPSYGNKEERFVEAELLIGSQRLCLPAVMTDEVRQQIDNFGVAGVHDDVPDTISTAAMLISSRVRGMSEESKKRFALLLRNAASRVPK